MQEVYYDGRISFWIHKHDKYTILKCENNKFRILRGQQIVNLYPEYKFIQKLQDKKLLTIETQ